MRIVVTEGALHGSYLCSARDEGTLAIVPRCGSGEDLVRYDLVADPGERFPVAGDGAHPVEARALRSSPPPEGAAADRNVEALEALGYVQ